MPPMPTNTADVTAGVHVDDQATVVPLRRGERRKQHTKRRLLDAAAETYAEVGVEGATISGITERADVGLGTFYLHFEDKDAIAIAVSTMVLNRLLQEEAEALADVREVGGEPDPLAVITRVVCARAADNPGLVCALLKWQGPRPGKDSDRPSSKSAGPDVTALHATYGPSGPGLEPTTLRSLLLPHLAARFRQGMETGRYRIEDPFLAAHATLGLYAECLPAWVADGRTDWDVLGTFAQRAAVAMFKR